MRLKLLYQQVDKFVIVEADKTYAGKEKPFNFTAHKDRYQWAAEKIIYLPIHVDTAGLFLGEDPTVDYWKIEFNQRGAIVKGCEGFDSFDVLIVSDVDEIPSREIITAVRSNRELRASVPFASRQHAFYYKLEHLREEVWHGSLFCTVGMARTFGTQFLRDRRNIFAPLQPGGWHLSFFNGAEAIQTKIRSFSHQEFNKDEFLRPDHINACIRDGKDLFNREVPTRKVGPEFFPLYFYEIARNYRHFFQETAEPSAG